MYPQLFLLDCVDFNPNFCHIDTLSDIAMMAVDLEMYLTHLSNNLEAKENGEELVRHFLNTYRHNAGESAEVWPLLEYYIIEKAMVCVYNCIIFENKPSLGEHYLDVVINHTKRLNDHLTQ